MTEAPPRKLPRLPLVDLRFSLARDRDALRAAFDDVLDSASFVLGATVARFESELASYVGARHAIGVASGSDALELTLRACGMGPGDAVVAPPFTFVATAEAVVNAGATPVFADIDPTTWLLDIDALAEQLARLPMREGTRRLPTGERVVGVIPVHLFGAVINPSSLAMLTSEHGVTIVEDAAQALGGGTQGVRVGSGSRATCFSFFPTKTLGALGDGGAITTSDDALAAELRALRQHGCRSPHHPHAIGRNSRLDALQAAFLSVKLRHLDDDIAARRSLFADYTRCLADLAPAVAVVHPGPPVDHAAQLLVVRAERRDELTQWLRERGIDASIYYPSALHACAPYSNAPRLGSLAHAEEATRHCLALPLFPGLTTEDVERVAGDIRAFYRALSIFLAAIALTTPRSGA